MKDMLNTEEAKQILKEAGLRLTKQRLLILDLLKNNRCHPCADDIINEIIDRYGHVTVATVYNTLDVLSKHGLILKIDGLETKSHYDPNTKPHFHATCVKCKKIYDLDIDTDNLSLPLNFSLTSCLIQGVCEECGKK